MGLHNFNDTLLHKAETYLVIHKLKQLYTLQYREISGKDFIIKKDEHNNILRILIFRVFFKTNSASTFMLNKNGIIY